MGAYESAGKLGKAMRELQFRWVEAKESWNDPVSRSFEAKYLQPLQQEMRSAITAMSDMASLLDHTRKECS